VAAAAGWSMVLVMGFPFLWMLATSLKPARDIFTTPLQLIPAEVTLDHFVALWQRTNFFTHLLNSTVVAFGVVVATLVVGGLGAYSLGRCRYPGRSQIAGLVLFTYMLAPVLMIIPFYVMMRQLGLVNSLVGLMLAQTSFCFPFALWLLRAYFKAIPIELEEAAWIDGASRLRGVVWIVAPLAVPGVIATAIFTFIVSWNDYLFALILITSDSLKTVPVGLQNLYQANLVEWGMFMAAGVVITLPVLAGFAFLQRYLLAGWGSGALKG
jgi:ABC-type glycerol-3-phosphate transport system permease component